MNSTLSDSSLWSEAVFGRIELGDKRLTKRLVQIGNQLSNCSGSSLSDGKSTQRNKRAYKDKESYKWEKNTHELEQRLSEKLADTISVCDRDADVYEYIQYKVVSAQAGVIRTLKAV